MCPAPKYSADEQLHMVLKAAESCIQRKSLMAFTMSDLSKEAGLSMGSIYKLIQTKEDVFLALAVEIQKQLKVIFETVLSLELPSMARFMGISLISYEKFFCVEFGESLQTILLNDAVLDRATKSWVERYVETDEAIEQVCIEYLQNTVDQELSHLESEQRQQIAQQLMLVSWSLCVGFQQVSRQRHARNIAGRNIELPHSLSIDHPIVQAQKHLINHFPWSEKVTDQQLQQVVEQLEKIGLR